MAYTDGPIGWVTASIADFSSPAASDGLIGWVVGTIKTPNLRSDGLIGWVVGEIGTPHYPVGVLVGGEIIFVPILTLINGTLQ